MPDISGRSQASLSHRRDRWPRLGVVAAICVLLFAGTAAGYDLRLSNLTVADRSIDNDDSHWEDFESEVSGLISPLDNRILVARLAFIAAADGDSFGSGDIIAAPGYDVGFDVVGQSGLYRLDIKTWVKGQLNVYDDLEGTPGTAYGRTPEFTQTLAWPWGSKQLRKLSPNKKVEWICDTNLKLKFQSSASSTLYFETVPVHFELKITSDPDGSCAEGFICSDGAEALSGSFCDSRSDDVGPSDGNEIAVRAGLRANGGFIAAHSFAADDYNLNGGTQSE
jgi:hypothetical protein